MGGKADVARWNHNIHYHPLVLAALPAAADRGLDVGCGEGMLARELRSRVGHVTGIDVHEPSIELARAHGRTAGVDYLVGEFLTHPFEPESFDVIVSVAALHHMEMRMGLARMRALLRPGGTLVIVGLARRSPFDVPFDMAGTVAHRWYKRRRTYWDHSAPVWPPPLTYRQTRRVAEAELPGVRYRRHLLFRYSLRWTTPMVIPGRRR